MRPFGLKCGLTDLGFGFREVRRQGVVFFLCHGNFGFYVVSHSSESTLALLLRLCTYGL